VVGARRVRRCGRPGGVRPARRRVQHRSRRGDRDPPLPARARRALARGWDRGAGPRALLACPPGERHDLGLILLGLALRDRGWRITFLGPDTPIPTLAATADRLGADVVVLSGLAEEPFASAAADVAGLAASHDVLLAGPGASGELAERSGARLLAGGPIEAAEWLSRSAAGRT